jgi:hypothetical protein
MTGSTSSDMLATAGAAAPHQSAHLAPDVFDLTADPIFAALDAWHSAKATREPAEQAVDSGSPEALAEDHSRPPWSVYDAAIDSQFEAKYAVCEVMPTTAAGAAALVRFLAAELMFDEVAYGSDAAEEAAKEALANLDRILTKISAAFEKAGVPWKSS